MAWKNLYNPKEDIQNIHLDLDELDGRISDTNNLVHQVDGNLSGDIQNVQDALSAHENRIDNPHSVTAEQIGAFKEAGGLVSGQITLANGVNIVPEVAEGSSLGTPEFPFKHLYVGPNSLYVDGNRVIGSTAVTLEVSTTIDQHLSVFTEGLGTTRLSSGKEVIIYSSDLLNIQAQGDIRALSSGRMEFRTTEQGQDIFFETRSSLSSINFLSKNRVNFQAPHIEFNNRPTVNEVPISLQQDTLDPEKVQQTSTHRFVSDQEKARWQDTYTKSDVENKLEEVVSDRDWKNAVDTYADLETAYPTPEIGWAVTVRDEDTTYRYGQEGWVDIGIGSIPNADQTTDGLMSASDKTKLNTIESEAERNQDAFGRISIDGEVASSSSQRDTISFSSGTNISIDGIDKNYTINVSGSVAQADDSHRLGGKLPEDFSLKGHGHTNATTLIDGFMSKEDKARLDEVESSSINKATADTLYAKVDDQVKAGTGLLGGGTLQSQPELSVNFNEVAAKTHRHDWADLDSKPTSTVQNLDESVAKMHDQNTDTGTTSSTFGVRLHTTKGTGGFYVGDDLLNAPYLRWDSANTRWDLLKSFNSELGHEFGHLRASHFTKDDGTAVSYEGHRHDNVTTTVDGYMSKEDKIKLNGVSPNAVNQTFTDGRYLKLSGGRLTGRLTAEQEIRAKGGIEWAVNNIVKASAVLSGDNLSFSSVAGNIQVDGHTVWHEGTFNPQDYSLTTHDHDHLYLKQAGDTLSGDLHFNANKAFFSGSGFTEGPIQMGATVYSVFQESAAIYNNGAGWRFINPDTLTDVMTLQQSGEMLLLGNKVFHEGNFNPSSKLGTGETAYDSDRLGGYQASHYAPKTDLHTHTNKTVIDAFSEQLGSLMWNGSVVGDVQKDGTLQENLNAEMLNGKTSDAFALQTDIAHLSDGDMRKDVYDINNSGVVDNAERLQGLQASDFSDVNHHHDNTYVNKTGDSLTGRLDFESSTFNEHIRLKRSTTSDVDISPTVNNGGGLYLSFDRLTSTRTFFGPDKILVSDAHEVWHEGNLSKSEFAVYNHAHHWDEITNKPVVFTPDIHTHEIEDVNQLQTTITNMNQEIDGKSNLNHEHTWGEINDKPTVFAPDTHTHSIGEVNLLTENLSNLEGDIARVEEDIVSINTKQTTMEGDISSLSTGKSDVGHGHIISDIDSLQFTLDGKSDTGHGHTIADVTNLQTELSSKADALHGHTIDDVQNLSSSLADKSDISHVHEWAEITLKPSTFTPSAHTHIISEVDGLRIELDGLQTNINAKADSGHGHVINDVTGLQAELDSKSSDGHTHTFASLTSKPSTVSGYGINNAYTKSEVDNLFDELSAGSEWKESVATYDDIATTYPSPEDGWTVNVDADNITYRYTGTEWIAISANAIPLVTSTTDGRMAKEDKEKLDQIEDQANLYVHPSSHAASMITESSARRFVSDTEKTSWNSKADGDHTHTELHSHTNKTVLDGTTASFTTSLESKLSAIEENAINQTTADARYVNQTGDTMTGNLNITGSVNPVMSFNAADEGTLYPEGIILSDVTDNGFPSHFQYGAVATFNTRSHTRMFQLVSDYKGRDLGFRSYHSNTSHLWSDFRRIWHDGNFNPDSKADAGHVHTWSEITEKPSTFTPSAHTHTIAQVDNLQTELDGVQTALDGKSSTSHTHSNASTLSDGFMSATDKTKIDGLQSGAINQSTADDLYINRTGDTMSGKLQIEGGFQEHIELMRGTNKWEFTPTTRVGGGLAVLGYNDTYEFYFGADNEFYIGDQSNKAWHSGNFNPLDKSDTGHSHSWTEITSKPSTFTPSAHTHSIAEVTNLQMALDNKMDADETLIDASTLNGYGSGDFLKANEANASDLRLSAGDERGIRFWDNSNYMIYMSATSHLSGGEIAGASDYNMYFRMRSGTNRGFVFLNDTTPIAQIESTGKLHTTNDIQAFDSSMLAQTFAITDAGNSSRFNINYSSLGAPNQGMQIRDDSNNLRMWIGREVDNPNIGIAPENGNVGIGTNTPSEKLHVDGNTNLNGSLYVSRPNTWSDTQFFDGNDLSLQILAGADSRSTIRSGTTYGLQVSAGNQPSSTTTPHLYIATNENVGVGTNTPDEKLDVKGSVKTDESFKIKDKVSMVYNESEESLDFIFN